MSRDTNTITTSTPPNNLLVGNQIQVTGAIVTSEYETISCNGTYTIQAIQGNNITVAETIPTNFTGNATLTKELYLGNILSIEDNTIYLSQPIEKTLTNLHISVHETTTGTVNTYTVASYTETTITTVEPIADYTPNYPLLQYPTPNTEVLVNVTSVKDSIAELFPIGEFIVDNFTQAVNYIGTVGTLTKPTTTIYENLYKEVPNTYPIETTMGISTMTLKGLYSQIYEETIIDTL